jgi:ABC-type dipeptide/oligopeptide/nickel transport system ATPase component
MSLFEKAESKANRLKMYVYGPSGSGKTVTSLHFRNPAVIDTEKGTNFYGDKFDFYRKQTQDHEVVGKAVDELLQDPKDFKTFVVDPIRRIDDSIVLRQLKRMRVKKNNANYSLQPLDYKVIKEERNILFRKILSLDMNIILTAPTKNQYSEDEGEFMKIIGVQPDGPKDLPYLVDVVLKLEKDEEGVRWAVVEKDRSNRLPERFEFSYPSFVKYLGVDGLEREAVQFEQQSSFNEAAGRNNEVVFQGTTMQTAGITADQLQELQTIVATLDEEEVNHKLLDEYAVTSALDLREDEAALFINSLKETTSTND